MTFYPGQNVRITSVLCTLLLVLIAPVFSYGEESGEFGSITGVVVCPGGDEIDGWVMLLDDVEIIFQDWDVGQDGEFSFDEVPPGDYTLRFYEHGEIPLGDFHEVEVVSGRNATVTITVPFTLSGMPCNDKLDMGIDGYFAFVDDLMGESDPMDICYSERALDWIAWMYGECKARENDYLIESLDENQQDLIIELRDAMEDYEWGFYMLEFFMGTGATRFATRTSPWREEFIDLAIRRIETPHSVPDNELNEALDIIDMLESAVDDVGEPYWDDESEEIFYESLDRFYDASERVRDIALELPDDILVELAYYLAMYVLT